MTTTPKPAAPVGDNGEGINPPASGSEETKPPIRPPVDDPKEEEKPNPEEGADQGENSQPVISDPTKPNNP